MLYVRGRGDEAVAQICVTLAEDDTPALIDRMVDLDPHADLFEVRGDLVRELDLLTLLRARKKPLLFTCRAVSEGGKAKDSHPERREMLLEAVKRGFEYVDIEHRAPLLEVVAGKAGKGLVVSFHDLSSTPDDLDRLYEEMAARGADVVKIVVTPRSFADVGRLVSFAARRAASPGTPLVAFAMGPLGVPTRILAGRFGAPFTFASVAPGAEAAPGQISARLMNELYRVRRISGRTRVYGIVGTDVSRSLSPALHNRAFAACGLDSRLPALQRRPARGLPGGAPGPRPRRLQRHPALQGRDPAPSADGGRRGGTRGQREHRGRRGRVACGASPPTASASWVRSSRSCPWKERASWSSGRGARRGPRPSRCAGKGRR